MKIPSSKKAILFVSSSKLGGRFPQRSDYLIEDLRSLDCNVIVVESHNPIFGIISSIRYMKVKWKIFSGFRAGVVGLFLSFIGFKWIYDFVEIKARLCKDNWRGIKRNLVPFIEALEKIMIKRASLVFSAGPSAYKYAKNLRDDIVPIPNGYDEFLFNSNNYSRDLLRTQYNVNFPLAVYIGKLTPMYAKFLVNAIRAMDSVNRQIPNAEFWIFGEGSSKSILQKIANKNVKFKGYIDHRKVPEILTIADVGLHAYDTESLKLIEWLAMGLPTIIPKGVQIDGVIECEWTPEEIAKQLIQVFRNPFRNPKKMPTWRESARLILEVLNRLDESA
ncbi:MAG: glycosyltransferase [Nitrososphaeria archaeon]